MTPSVPVLTKFDCTLLAYWLIDVVVLLQNLLFCSHKAFIGATVENNDDCYKS